MEYPMRTKLTHEGLLVQLANHFNHLKCPGVLKGSSALASSNKIDNWPSVWTQVNLDIIRQTVSKRSIHLSHGTQSSLGTFHGLMAKVLDCGLELSKFEL